MFPGSASRPPRPVGYLTESGSAWTSGLKPSGKILCLLSYDVRSPVSATAPKPEAEFALWRGVGAFAGGDIVTGSATVILAAGGRCPCLEGARKAGRGSVADAHTLAPTGSGP